MTGLFTRIWLGILAALVICTAVSGATMKLLLDRERSAFIPERAAIALMKSRLEQAHPGDRPAIVREFQEVLPFDLVLIPAGEVPARAAEEMRQTGATASEFTDGGIRVFAPIADSNAVLAVGPIPPPPHPEVSHFLVSIAAALFVAACIGFALAYPVVRRLRKLEYAAGRIAGGDLGARADVSSADAVGTLARRFNIMAQEIQRLLESQRHLLAAVSHELRTPIARIHFSMEMLAEDLDGQKRNERMKVIEGDLEELERLIAELLLFCRLDAQHSPHPAETFGAVDAVAELVGKFAPEFSANANVSVYFASDETVDDRVAANRRQFDRAVRNALDNAMRHASSVVNVRVARTGGHVVIEIADDGPGIPKADRSRVFEPFTRLDDSRSRDLGGAGLGLAIVMRIMRAHGGSAEFVDRVADGACLRLRWPVE